MFRFLTALVCSAALVGCGVSEAAHGVGGGLLGGRGIGLGGLFGGGAFNGGLGFNNFGAGLGFNNVNRHRFNNRIIVVPGQSFGYGAGLGCASYVPPVQTFAAPIQTFAAPQCDCSGAQALNYGASYGASGFNAPIGYSAGLGVGTCNAGFSGYGAGFGTPIILRGHAFHHHHH